MSLSSLVVAFAVLHIVVAGHGLTSNYKPKVTQFYAGYWHACTLAFSFALDFQLFLSLSLSLAHFS